MGMRGPAPKPNVIKLLTGNPSRRPINLADGVNPEVVVPDPPQWLNRDARKEWKRITVELERLGLISRLDRSALTLYCQCWGQLSELEQAFNAQQKMALGQAEKAGVDPTIAVVQPYVAKTPTGFMRESALFRVMSQLREDVNRYLAAFGLSPSARMRVKASDGQLPLPGLEPANSDDKPTLKHFA